VNDRIKTTIKAIMIKTILIIFFIKNVEFAVYWYLVYVFSHPQVDFTAVWSSRDLGPPIVSVLSPLLLAISDDIIVNGGNTKSWRRFCCALHCHVVSLKELWQVSTFQYMNLILGSASVS